MRDGEYGCRARGGAGGGVRCVCGARGLFVVEQRTDRVPHPDHAMRGGGEDSGQEAGPPHGQDLAPGPLGQLAGEVVGPVREVPGIAERLPPRGLGDRRDAARPVLQLAAVGIEPAVHGARLPVPDQRLHRHGRMVGQPARTFGAGAVQSFESFVEDAARVVHGRTLGSRAQTRNGREDQPRLVPAAGDHRPGSWLFCGRGVWCVGVAAQATAGERMWWCGRSRRLVSVLGYGRRTGRGCP